MHNQPDPHAACSREDHEPKTTTADEFIRIGAPTNQSYYGMGAWQLKRPFTFFFLADNQFAAGRRATGTRRYRSETAGGNGRQKSRESGGWARAFIFMHRLARSGGDEACVFAHSCT